MPDYKELSKQEWLQIPETGTEAVPKEMKAYVKHIAKELVPLERIWINWAMISGI
jgi:hypothetical protein